MAQVPLAQGQNANPKIRMQQGDGVLDLLGKADRFVNEGPPLSESPLLGKAPDQPDTALYDEQATQGEAFIPTLAGNGRYSPPEARHCPRVVTQGVVDLAQQLIGLDLEADIPRRGSKGNGALASHQGTVMRAYVGERYWVIEARTLPSRRRSPRTSARLSAVCRCSWTCAISRSGR